jgi:4-hydroxybenzoate polyprenyltransferase
MGAQESKRVGRGIAACIVAGFAVGWLVDNPNVQWLLALAVLAVTCLFSLVLPARHKGQDPPR